MTEVEPKLFERDLQTMSTLRVDDARPARSRARRRWQSGITRRTWITDTIVVITAVTVAQFVRFGSTPAAAQSDPNLSLNYTIISAAIAGCWIAALAIYGTHSPRVYGSGPDEYRLIVSATVRLFGALAICALVFRIDFARLYLAIAFPLGLALLLLTRWLARRGIARKRERGENRAAVIVVGRERAVAELARSFDRYLESGHEVVGACIPGRSKLQKTDLLVDGRRIPVFGDEHSLVAALEYCEADTVAVTATEELGPDGMRKIVWDLDPYDVDLVVSPGVVDVAGPRLVMRPVAGLPLIHVEKPTYRGSKRFGKTVFDVCFALCALIVTMPLLIVTAIAVKLDSAGPVFYRSERVGVGGKTFAMLKFRSMVDGADQRLDDLIAQNEGAGVLFKMRDDPRVTRVGRFIRRLSIDEVPQFINVLKRDMSVVGPRPPFCAADGRCPSFVGTTPVKRDQVHMTPDCAALIAPAVRESLDAAGVLE